MELTFHVRRISTYLQHRIFWELQGSSSPNLLVHILSLSEIPAVELFHFSLELDNQSDWGIFFPMTLLRLFLFPIMPLVLYASASTHQNSLLSSNFLAYYLSPFSSWWKTICPSLYEVIPMIPFFLCPKDFACLFIITHSMKYCYWEMCNSQPTLIRHF